MKVSAFPKCYLDDISVHRTMTVFEWIEMAKTLDADGLEMYEGFFQNLDSAYIDQVGEAISAAGFEMPMLCCSPDFTSPDPDKRKRELDREAAMIAVSRRLGGPGTVCRVLSGQRYPEVSVEQGLEWAIEGIEQSLKIAAEYQIVLGLENHYKDGQWKYPEFAQKKTVFLRLVNALRAHANFGVQYDPSNAFIAGDEPLALLAEVADRVVSMHASDRYLTNGAKVEDLIQADGTIGYSPDLLHGVTGKGLNDYHAIFGILAKHNYRGWVSIEDGMNGIDEMRESLAFLRGVGDKYFAGSVR